MERFRKFPVKKNEKSPAITDWQELATSDPLQIEKWKQEFPDCNWGIVTGNGFVVVDVDVKNGKDGFSSLRSLFPGYNEEDLDTFTVGTPQGGQHLYFLTEEDLHNKQGVLPGVDTRGSGGLVVAPGSTINGKSYTVLKDKPLLPLPDWLRVVVTSKNISSSRLDSETPPPLLETFSGLAPVQELQEDVSRFLASGHVADQSYDNWRDFIFSILKRFGTSSEVIELAKDYSKSCPKRYQESDFWKLVNSYHPAKQVGDHYQRLLGEYFKKSGRVYSQYHSTYTLPEVEDQTLAEELSSAVLTETLNILERFGNRADQKLKDGLGEVCQGLVYGLLSKQDFRNAYPLDTGLGKTTAVKALLKIISDRNLPFGILVAAETIDQLAELQRDVIDLGIPFQKIGIFHNSQDKDVESLNRGEIDNTQFLLIAHARVKNRYIELDPYLTYNGNPRELVIWDERLTTTMGDAVTRMDLIGKLNEWIGRYEGKRADGLPVEDHWTEFYEFGKTTKDLLLNVATDEEIELPYLDPYRDWSALVGSDSLLRILTDAARNTDTGQRVKVVQPKEKAAVIQFYITVPDSLRQIVILDASAPIAKLGHYDRSITIAPLEVKRDHSAVTLFFRQFRSSRDHLQEQKNLDRYLKELKHLLQNEIPQGEEVLVLTHKAREGSPNFKDQILKTVDSLGLGYKERIHVITYGSHKGVNKFSQVRYVVTVGVQYRDVQELAASILGQKRSLSGSVTNAEISKVQVSEQADLLYQAVSRGHLRRTTDGKAGEMRIYLFHWEIAEVVEILKERMLGIKVVPYTPTFLVRDTHSDAIYPEVAEKIVEFLERQTKDKVSTQETRKALERSGLKLSKKIWELAIQHVGTLQVEWELCSKSFERQKL